MSLQVLVRQAFANTQPPDGEYFATVNDEGASRVFVGARWEQLGTEQLRHNCAAMSFFAPEAFAYFLPAFILASLADHGVRDALLWMLLPPKADPTRPSFAAWWGRLTSPQKSAVIAFLDYCVETGACLNSASLDALKSRGGPITSAVRPREG